jgi:hypothetical protein
VCLIASNANACPALGQVALSFVSVYRHRSGRDSAFLQLRLGWYGCIGCTSFTHIESWPWWGRGQKGGSLTLLEPWPWCGRTSLPHFQPWPWWGREQEGGAFTQLNLCLGGAGSRRADLSLTSNPGRGGAESRRADLFASFRTFHSFRTLAVVGQEAEGQLFHSFPTLAVVAQGAEGLSRTRSGGAVYSGTVVEQHSVNDLLALLGVQFQSDAVATQQGPANAA